MAQKDDSENDIWEYKPLEKKKRTGDNVSGTVAKKKRTRKPGKRDTVTPVRNTKPKQAAESGNDSIHVKTQEHNSLEALPSQSPANETPKTDDNTPQGSGSSSGDFCPICQMPFSVLVVQSQRWHVAECLDIPRDQCKGTEICTYFDVDYTEYSINLSPH